MPEDSAEPLYKYVIHAAGSSDALQLQEFSGTELVNDLSLFRLRAYAPDSINVEDYIGNQMRLELKVAGGPVRDFNLTVFGVRQLLHEGKGKHYEFELRPWLHFLTKRTNSRIFKQMSVLDALRTILEEYGGATGQIDDKSHANFPVLEYLVQFRETDLDFMRRLLEQYGVNFCVKMDASKQTLVLFESGDDFDSAATDTATFSPDTAAAARSPWNITSWTANRQVTTGKVRLIDYDFEAPNQSMETLQQDTQRYPGANLEYYDYPGGYDRDGDANNFAKRRLDAFRAMEKTVRADGNLYQLGAGMLVTVESENEALSDDPYAVLAATHYIAPTNTRSGTRSIESARYSGSYVLTMKSNKVSPPLVTPRPVMRGPQTGVVTDGADGTTDRYGRVRVKLFWAGEEDTIYIRVSQMWASKNWGSVFIPYAGMEVIVDFLDGNPDRPIVVGCVYNDNNMPPWPLPGQKTISGIKTVRENELSFDDKDGAEKIHIHARYDMNTEVLNNETRAITKDSTITIDQNRKMTVQGTELKEVTGSLTLKSTQEIILQVGENKITISQSGVSINGLQVSVKATGALTTEGGATAEHKASGMLSITGSLVKIN